MTYTYLATKLPKQQIILINQIDQDLELNQVKYIEAGNERISFLIKVEHDPDEKTYITNELDFFLQQELKVAYLLLSTINIFINTKEDKISYNYPELFDFNNKIFSGEDSLSYRIIQDFINIMLYENKATSYKSLHKRLKSNKSYNPKKKDLTNIFNDYLSTFDF